MRINKYIYYTHSITSHYISVPSEPHHFVRRLVSFSGLLSSSHLLLDQCVTAGRLGKELVHDELVVSTPPEVMQTETMTIKDMYKFWEANIHVLSHLLHLLLLLPKGFIVVLLIMPLSISTRATGLFA